MNLRTSRSARKITAWLRTKGYTLKPGREYCCFWQEKVITYRPQDSRDTTIFSLLHECGHVLVGRAVDRDTAHVRYKRGYPSPAIGAARSNVSAADVVHEEIEAWHRGYELGRRLGVRMNSDLFWRHYGFCVKRYFRRMIERVI